MHRLESRKVLCSCVVFDRSLCQGIVMLMREIYTDFMRIFLHQNSVKITQWTLTFHQIAVQKHSLPSSFPPPLSHSLPPTKQ